MGKRVVLTNGRTLTSEYTSILFDFEKALTVTVRR
jgi:hypothetical protein